jgi:hypothetical protein
LGIGALLTVRMVFWLLQRGIRFDPDLASVAA